MNKRLLLIPLALLLAISLVAIGCPGEKAETGGTLRYSIAQGPLMMSYRPFMGPGDHTTMFPGVEMLVDSAYDNGVRHFEPVLCESYNIDPVAKTFTFNLRQGVKFHDGSEMTAEVVKWNFEQQIEGGWTQDADKITSIETPDNYTVVIHFTEYSNQYEFNWGWTNIYSKAAWDAASGGDLQAGIDWAVDHVVGTGPFKLVEYQRDVVLKWEKFDDYWQEGKPYLDAVECWIVPDSVTASLKLQAGEIDMWAQGSAARDWVELADKDFVVQNFWPGLPQMLMGNTVNPDSKWNDIRVRKALEYAVDKAAIAQALGLGYYKPLAQIAPEGEWGYLPDYPVRGYDPAMARQLLAEAGFANGCPVTLLINNAPPSIDAGEAIKSYLDDAGFQCELDIADMGRYYTEVFGTGWEDLLFMFYGMDVNNLATYISWFSSDPKSNLVSFKRPPEQIAMDQQVVLIPDTAGQKAMTEEIFRYMMDEALLCPLYWPPAAYVMYDYVHTDYYQQGFIRWKIADTWMDPH